MPRLPLLAAPSSMGHGQRWRPSNAAAFCAASPMPSAAMRTPLPTVETRCGGKTLANSRNEVEAAARVFDYYAGAMDKFFGETIPMGDGVLDFTLREPVGVVAQITPWNFPFLAAAWKVAPALAAGCTAILKPASYTPLTSILLGRACHGGRRAAGSAQRSARAGSAAWRAHCPPSADRQDRLHGRDPHRRQSAQGSGRRDQARLARARRQEPEHRFRRCRSAEGGGRRRRGGFGNAGQSCSARTRLFVERTVHDALVEAFAEATKCFKVGDPLELETEMGPLVSASQWKNVKSMVDDGVSEGARIDLRRRSSAQVCRSAVFRADDHDRRGQWHAHRAGRDFWPGGRGDPV